MKYAQCSPMTSHPILNHILYPIRMFPTIKDIPTNIHAIIFDLDGTLYNKQGLSLRMLLHAPFDVRRMYIERKTRASMKGLYLGDEMTFYTQYFERMSAQASDASTWRSWYENRYMPLMVKMIKQHQPLGSWVMPFIKQCQQQGIRLVVLSDYGHTHDKLLALGLAPQLFDWVISAPELGGLKPASELLYQVAEKMHVTPSECLVIGDRDDTDGKMAHATQAAFFKVSY